MIAYFASMARANCTKIAEEIDPPSMNATVTVGELEIIVDLTDHIDLDAERVRLGKERERLEKLILGKQNKLSNEKFVSNAPAEIVEREREGIVKMQAQLAAIVAGLLALIEKIEQRSD